MSYEDVSQRPIKKRRFFVDDSDTNNAPVAGLVDRDAHQRHTESSLAGHDRESERNGSIVENGHVDQSQRDGLDGYPDVRDSRIPDERVEAQQNGLPKPESESAMDTPPQHAIEREQAQESPTSTGFNADAFTGIIGVQLPQDTIEKIRIAASNSVEKAIHIYLDGSWEKPATTNPPPSAPAPVPQQTQNGAQTQEASPAERGQETTSQPMWRYIGAFGVGAWATRSGTGLVNYGEQVNIERFRTQPIVKRGGRGSNKKEDIITRFTNQRQQEVGRLPRETAEWVSTLIDQKVCRFEGSCVFAPDRIRVNDTIYLQLRCYLLKTAFQPFIEAGSGDDNRSLGIFEEKESAEEKNLRLRQVALVKLFDEIGLAPSSANEMTGKHKKDGLLRAAEMAENYDKTKRDNNKTTRDSNNEEPEEEQQELEEDQLDTLYKKAQSFDFNTPEAEPPSTFAMSLRKYQKQALHWMLAKEMDRNSDRARSMHPLWEQYTWPLKDAEDNELPVIKGLEHFYVNPYSGELSLDFPAQNQRCLGGILADEMGLGKTIEMMSLIHAHRIQPEQKASDELAINNGNDTPPNVVAAPYTTLIVAPTTLLSQWESEAVKASQAGTVNVLVYYGNDKSFSLKHLCAESNAESAPTVVITSYGVVLSEFRSLMSQQSWTPETSGLFSLNFFRIILDEAHVIKNRNSKSAKACYELKSAHRWILTGTPIVNRLEDLFSLVRFLKVEPWSNFSFWKTFITVPFENKDYARALNVVQTVLEPLVLRRTKTMKTPDGEPLVPLPPRTINIEEVELSTPEREIYDFIYTRARQTFKSNVEAGTLLKSFTTIIAQILRLRQTCCHPVLTRKTAPVVDEEVAAAAVDASDELKDDMDLQQLIDRFTAATQNADAEQKPDSSTKFTTHALRQIQNDASGECPICAEEPMTDPAVTSCWHSACKKCLEDYIRHQTDKGMSPRCFSCRGPISSRDIFEIVRHSPTSTPQQDDDVFSSTPPSSSQPTPRISLRRVHPVSPASHTSAKIHALINHLKTRPSNTKSVVFSQFTSFLDLIEPQLTRAGISHLRLDGTMHQKARADVLAQFNKTNESYDREDIDNEEEDVNPAAAAAAAAAAADGDDNANNGDGEKPRRSARNRPRNENSDSGPNVLLISLRVGGVGLNLTAASNVFMMDPWWSFAVEAQAIDRVHRMGQLRDTNVTRFVVRDSIEERILRVQERKMNIAGSLGLRVGGDGREDDNKKERVEELKLLFE